MHYLQAHFQVCMDVSLELAEKRRMKGAAGLMSCSTRSFWYMYVLTRPRTLPSNPVLPAEASVYIQKTNSYTMCVHNSKNLPGHVKKNTYSQHAGSVDGYLTILR